MKNITSSQNNWHKKIRPIKKTLTILWATSLLIWEITASILALPAWYNAVTSPSEWIYQKSIDWIRVPLDIMNFIIEFPDFADHIIVLMEAEEKYWNDVSDLIDEDSGILDKISTLRKISNTPWISQDIDSLKASVPVLVEYEKNKIDTLETTADNLLNHKFETLWAAAIAFLFYYFLLRLTLQMIRLKDKDTISSTIRKKAYRFITGKQSVKSKIDWLDIKHADIEELKELLDEIQSEVN